jgi:hypothetical protein
MNPRNEKFNYRPAATAEVGMLMRVSNGKYTFLTLEVVSVSVAAQRTTIGLSVRGGSHATRRLSFENGAPVTFVEEMAA